MRRVALTLAATAALAATSPAEGAITLHNYSFTGAGIGTGTYSTAYNDVTFASSLTAFNFTLGSTTFDTSNVVLQNGYVGGAAAGAETLLLSTDDFYFPFVSVFGGATASVTMTYFTVGTNTAGTSQLTIREVTPAPLPELSTWAMMLLGFGGIGVVLRRRRRPAPAQIA